MSAALLFPFCSATVRIYTLLGPFGFVGGGVTVVVGGVAATDTATSGPGVDPPEFPPGGDAAAGDVPDWPLFAGCDPVGTELDGVAAAGA